MQDANKRSALHPSIRRNALRLLGSIAYTCLLSAYQNHGFPMNR